MTDERRVDINYIKSESYREVACDGILGGPTPNGKLWLGFYTERFPLPRVMRHVVRSLDGGAVELEVPGEKIEGRDGIIRNVEFGIYMSVTEAAELRRWLAEELGNMEEDADEQAASPVADRIVPTDR